MGQVDIIKTCIGLKINKLTLLEYAGKKRGQYMVLLRCDCGRKTTMRWSNFRHRYCSTCGCGKLEIKNPLTKHPLYTTWASIKERCLNPKCYGYKNYGGRGVKICEEWRNDFKSFYDWAIMHGWVKGLEIDKDILGDGLLYSPDTCCIVTRTTNSRNKRTTKLTLAIAEEIRKSTLSSKELAAIYNVHPFTINCVKRGDTWKP